MNDTTASSEHKAMPVKETHTMNVNGDPEALEKMRGYFEANCPCAKKIEGVDCVISMQSFTINNSTRHATFTMDIITQQCKSTQ